MKSTHSIKRRKSKQIFVGNVAIGGNAPISVQSMTNTDKDLLRFSSFDTVGRFHCCFL